MTFYIIITRSNGSELAAAVYSSRKKAEAYISDTNMADSRIEPYEVPAGETFSTVMMYAAHKTNEGGASEVIGFYFNIYDAENAVNNNGFVERLPIDKVEEEMAGNSTESEEGFKAFKLEGRKAPPPESTSYCFRKTSQYGANGTKHEIRLGSSCGSYNFNYRGKYCISCLLL